MELLPIPDQAPDTQVAKKEESDCGSDQAKCKLKQTPEHPNTSKEKKRKNAQKSHVDHDGKVQYSDISYGFADFLALGFASLDFLRAPTAANASSGGSSTGARFLPLG